MVYLQKIHENKNSEEKYDENASAWKSVLTLVLTHCGVYKKSEK